MIAYRMLEPGDIPEALAISRVQLGSDYLSERDFREAMEDPGQFCIVAVDGDDVAGFAICQVFGPEMESEKLKLPDCPERDEVIATERIGLLDSVAVSGDRCGRGIGAGLCSRCAEEMERRGCGMVCAMAWKNIHGVTNIAKVLGRLGLRETVSIRGYWNGMVDSPGGHDCPVCGAPCRCWGVFWYRRLRCPCDRCDGSSVPGFRPRDEPVGYVPVDPGVIHLVQDLVSHPGI